MKNLEQSIYVDDIVSGAKDEESTFQLYAQAKAALKEGGFNLRKFVTSSRTLQERIDAQETATSAASIPERAEETYAKTTLGPTQSIQPGEQKILGIRWRTDSDQLTLNVDDVAEWARKLDPTKRNIISIVGRFYDPMGFLAPLVIRFKVFFQDLCESKVDWDQPLTGDLLKRWKSLLYGLDGGQHVMIPRYFLDGIGQEVKSLSLHGFCDASRMAYAAVIYLVMETSGARLTKFVASKTRVAPLCGQTIPRLELLSALLLARLMDTVISSLSAQLHLAEPVCYTDSKVALFWIVGSEKEWKQFVQNRVLEIRKLQLLASLPWQGESRRPPITGPHNDGAFRQHVVVGWTQLAQGPRA